MFKRSKTWAFAGALTLCAAGAPVYAQTQGSAQQQRAIDIINWDAAQLRGGYSANRLIGMDVRGRDGKSLGEVEDILVDTDGKATAIVVESGGFLDIGDKHFRIPWDQARLAASLDHLVIPLTKENAELYRDTREREKVRTRAREYRVSELRYDVVTLRDGAHYGRVDDLIIGRKGNVEAVVVDPVRKDMATQDRYAYPWRGGTVDFDRNRYALPYERAQINRLKPFNYRAFNIMEPTTRGTGATGTGAGGEQRLEQRARPARQENR